jgi:predicted SAM-dependent methyltransferase
VETHVSEPRRSKVRTLLGRDARLWKVAKATYAAGLQLNRWLVLAATWKSRRNVLALQPGGLQVQLGCGDRGIAGMLNIDARMTRAADMVADCCTLGRFDDKSLTMIFSNAFFEHLYRQQQLPLLQDCVRTLKPGGFLLFVGIPDFETVCREYLAANSGTIGDYSRLEWAYRYTHGDPEQFPEWWIKQLHKSLFDSDELAALARSAGFAAVMVFRYCYPGETWPVNLGLCAGSSVSEVVLRQSLKRFGEYVDVTTVDVIPSVGKS